MSKRGGQLREKNGFWKGGRTVASNGYILVKVGFDHPLADVRGYAYEHRLVAERKIGRPLLPGEQVHHIDGNKQNNAPLNLEVVMGGIEHHFRHRSPSSVRRHPLELNTTVACACGCGGKLPRFDALNRPRMYITGHNPMASPAQDSVLAALKDGAKHRNELIQSIDCDVPSALRELRKRGLAQPIGKGVWQHVQ